MNDIFDAVVVGGGINGAGVARDLAGRGLRVALCEPDDWGAHTSSSSSKLIHGGLRYLEHREWGLVRKALSEREGLLRASPHIMRPLRFILPHDASMRPAWMIRAGLFLYDHLATRDWLPGSEMLSLSRHPAGAPLKPEFRWGFAYSDGWVDDARLVLLCVRDAVDRGARAMKSWRCERLSRADAAAAGATPAGLARHPSDEGLWTVHLRHVGTGELKALQARSVINATGPWAARWMESAYSAAPRRSLRCVRGSHIVVAKRWPHPYAYIFQNPDGRVLFALPFEGDHTLLGTTDVAHEGDLGQVSPSPEEIRYLCEQASRYLKAPVQQQDIVWSYAGVRPLMDGETGSLQSLSRDYQCEWVPGAPGLMAIWGGKITTFRRLAEEVGDAVVSALGRGGKAWTANQSLPGGQWPGRPLNSKDPQADLWRWGAQHFQGLSPQRWTQRDRWLRCYGGLLTQWWPGADRPQDWGQEVAPGLWEAELRYLREHEWATTAEDVLWRRTKMGLRLSGEQQDALARWFQDA